jgi:hypothetical protein
LLYEYIGNLHLHSPYSDGYGSHQDIAIAALKAGLDFVVVTDHNVLVKGMDGYRHAGDRRVLLLTGEEIHDQNRDPQKNHLLAYEAGEELAHLATEPQELIDGVRKRQGLAFLAHPVDPAAPAVHQPDLSWVDWDIDRFTGLEIWNYMTEFKSHMHSIPHALYYAYNPVQSAVGPFQETLQRWDGLLAEGRRVVAIGGSDAHATPVQWGPLKRVILPYEFLFRSVNTHVLTEAPLAGDLEQDRRTIFESIRQGRCFVGYDAPASTKGFRFSGQGDGEQVAMGGRIRAEFGITLQASLPGRAELRLLRNGDLVRRWRDAKTGVHTVTEPGAYRVEAFMVYKGKRRGWIFSNPIYVRS